MNVSDSFSLIKLNGNIYDSQKLDDLISKI